MSRLLCFIMLLIALSAFIATPTERIIAVAGGCAIAIFQWAEERQLFRKQATSEAVQEVVELLNDHSSENDQT
jgi:hypothetical protein